MTFSPLISRQVEVKRTDFRSLFLNKIYVFASSAIMLNLLTLSSLIHSQNIISVTAISGAESHRSTQNQNPTKRKYIRRANYHPRQYVASDSESSDTQTKSTKKQYRKVNLIDHLWYSFGYLPNDLVVERNDDILHSALIQLGHTDEEARALIQLKPMDPTDKPIPDGTQPGPDQTNTNGGDSSQQAAADGQKKDKKDSLFGIEEFDKDKGFKTSDKLISESIIQAAKAIEVLVSKTNNNDVVQVSDDKAEESCYAILKMKGLISNPDKTTTSTTPSTGSSGSGTAQATTDSFLETFKKYMDSVEKKRERKKEELKQKDQDAASTDPSIIEAKNKKFLKKHQILEKAYAGCQNAIDHHSGIFGKYSLYIIGGIIGVAIVGGGGIFYYLMHQKSSSGTGKSNDDSIMSDTLSMHSSSSPKSGHASMAKSRGTGKPKPKAKR